MDSKTVKGISNIFEIICQVCKTTKCEYFVNSLPFANPTIRIIHLRLMALCFGGGSRASAPLASTTNGRIAKTKTLLEMSILWKCRVESTKIRLAISHCALPTNCSIKILFWKFKTTLMRMFVTIYNRHESWLWWCQWCWWQGWWWWWWPGYNNDHHDIALAEVGSKMICCRLPSAQGNTADLSNSVKCWLNFKTG